MKTNIIYDKKTGRISAYSDKKIDTPEEQITLDLTADEYQKFKDNWIPFYRNEKLEFEKPAYLIADDKKEKLEKVKKDVNSATDITQLKKAVKELLDDVISTNNLLNL